jgi:hypothetical protein
VVEFDELVQCRGSVRFNSHNKNAPVVALYVRRAGWEALGEPALVRIRLEPLT